MKGTEEGLLFVTLCAYPDMTARDSEDDLKDWLDYFRYYEVFNLMVSLLV